MRAGALLVVLFGMIVLFSVARASRADDAPMGFSQAIRTIIDRSTDVQARTAQLHQTVAEDIPARAAFLPSLSADLSRSTLRDTSLGQQSTSDSASFDAKLNLFKFGADYEGWRAAVESEDSQELELTDTILRTEQAAVSALVTEIHDAQDTQVLDQIVKKEQELLKIGRERYDRGLLPAQEVDKIEVDMENAAAKLADAQSQEVSARATLVSLLGNARIQPAWPWVARLRDLSEHPNEADALSGSDADLARRPDVRAAEKNLESQGSLESQRIRQALPSVDTDFNYTTYGLLYQSALGGPTDPTWTASLTLSIPIFDRLSGYSAARTQYFEKEKADIALEAARRQAMSDWSSARENFRIALSTAMARAKTVRISRKLYDDSLRRFRLGRINANDLSLDEQRLSDSELLANAGWAQAHLALSELCHARGLRVDECF